MFTEGCLMIRRILAIVLWLIALGTVNVASAETPIELTKQCQKGKAESCGTLGDFYAIGLGVTQDYAKAVELYRKACEGQATAGCTNLGRMYENGNGVRQSVEDALRFYGKACDLKNTEGCEYYARLKTGKK